jgi:NADPH:quinone reductase-like Zn-dependent oxidoreductase
LSVNRLEELDTIKQDLLRQVQPQRVLYQKIKSAPPLKLDIERPGLLDTLHFVEEKGILEPLDPTEVEIDVKAVGLNSFDTLYIMGRSKRNLLGAECSGTIIRAGEKSGLKVGDNVVFYGINNFGTISRSKSAVVIPDGMTFEEAASVSLSFTPAYNALIKIARARAGEWVLIHNGSCSTGQACIQVAQLLGLTVIITVANMIRSKN